LKTQFQSTKFKVPALVGCSATSLGDWCTTFHDSVMVTHSRVKKIHDILDVYFDLRSEDHYADSKRLAPITQW